MASLPRTCQHCGRKVHHYGACTCIDGQLGEIDREREALNARLKRLDDKEREVLGLRADTPNT